MSAQFEKAVSIVQSMPKDGPVKPSQNDQLTFYGLYKQATVGDVNTTRPGMLDIVGKSKWDAWDKLRGKSSDEAKQEYVQTLLTLLKRHEGDEDAKKWVSEIETAK